MGPYVGPGSNQRQEIRLGVTPPSNVGSQIPPSAGRDGAPRARRMLTDTDPAAQRLYDLFGLDAYAPKR